VCGWSLNRAGRCRRSHAIWACIRRRCAKRVRQAEIDAGGRSGVSSVEIRRLRKENYELRRANEILKAASVFFAKELDPDRTK